MALGIFAVAFQKRSLPPYTRVRWRGMVRCGAFATKARKSMVVETSFAGALVRECTDRVRRTGLRARRCCKVVAWLYLDLGISRTVQAIMMNALGNVHTGLAYWASSVRCRHWSRHIEKSKLYLTRLGDQHLHNKCRHLDMPGGPRPLVKRWCALHDKFISVKIGLLNVSAEQSWSIQLSLLWMLTWALSAHTSLSSVTPLFV